MLAVELHPEAGGARRLSGLAGPRHPRQGHTWADDSHRPAARYLQRSGRLGAGTDRRHFEAGFLVTTGQRRRMEIDRAALAANRWPWQAAPGRSAFLQRAFLRHGVRVQPAKPAERLSKSAKSANAPAALNARRHDDPADGAGAPVIQRMHRTYWGLIRDATLDWEQLARIFRQRRDPAAAAPAAQRPLCRRSAAVSRAFCHSGPGPPAPTAPGHEWPVVSASA